MIIVITDESDKMWPIPLAGTAKQHFPGTTATVLEVTSK